MPCDNAVDSSFPPSVDATGAEEWAITANNLFKASPPFRASRLAVHIRPGANARPPCESLAVAATRAEALGWTRLGAEHVHSEARRHGVVGDALSAVRRSAVSALGVIDELSPTPFDPQELARLFAAAQMRGLPNSAPNADVFSKLDARPGRQRAKRVARETLLAPAEAHQAWLAHWSLLSDTAHREPSPLPQHSLALAFTESLAAVKASRSARFEGLHLTVLELALLCIDEELGGAEDLGYTYTGVLGAIRETARAVDVLEEIDSTLWPLSLSLSVAKLYVRPTDTTRNNFV